ncbi:MAG: hypothetical protein ACR2QM_04925 [Longimicrobiales bacterium]
MEKLQRGLAAFLLVSLMACQTWVPTTESPRIVVTEQTPSSVRVTQADGEVVTIRSPTVRNDSILAIGDGFAPTVGVSEFEVRTFEVRQINTAKTIGFIAGLIAVGLTWANSVGGSNPGTDTGPGPLPKLQGGR